MAFKVQYLLLADQVQDVQSGKLNVLGLWNQMNLREMPYRHPGFIVVALVQAENEDDLHHHRLDCQLLRPNGQMAAQTGGTLNMPLNPGPGPLSIARIVIGLQNVPIREFGTHRVVLRVDDKVVGDHPFYVVQVPAPQP